MRTGLFAILLGLALLAACDLDDADDTYEPPARFELPLNRYVLGNGLEVVIVPNRIMPVVLIEVGIRAGSILETPETNGFAHFVEHMVVKRGLAVDDSDELMDQLRQRGVLYNASTSQDAALYYYEVCRDQLSEVLGLVAKSVTQPVFGEQQVDNERGTILSEMDLYDAAPESDAFAWRDILLFSDYQERRNVLGDREVVLNATAADLQQFHSEWYVPSNAVVVLAGDVEPSEGLSIVEEHFDHWPKTEDPFAIHKIPEYAPLERDKTAVLHGEMSDTMIVVAWQGPDTRRHRRDTVIGDLLVRLTYQPFNAFRFLVDKELASSSSFGYLTKRHTGTAQVVLTLPSGNEHKTLDAVMYLLRSMAEPDWITEDELTMAKDELWFNWVARLNEATSAGRDTGVWWGLADLDYFADYLDEVSTVTKEDISDFIKRYMYHKPKVTVLQTSAENAARRGLTNQWLEQTVAW